MAIQSQPSRIPQPFAGSGTKNTIPATNSTPSASQAASWASGFPPECSQPISAGGCPVPRNDMNGALNWLSQDFAFRQDGGIWQWSALADYDAGRFVRGSDGSFYKSAAQSGPATAAGAKDPIADDGTYWIKMPSMADIAAQGYATQTWVKTIAVAPIYVDSSKATSGDGLTAATAVKTFAEAIAIAKQNQNQNCHFIVAGGTYAEAVNLTKLSCQIDFTGNATISGGISIYIDSNINCSGSSYTITTSNIHIDSRSSFTTNMSVVIVGASGVIPLEVTACSYFLCTGSCSVTGNSTYQTVAATYGATITINGNLTCTSNAMSDASIRLFMNSSLFLGGDIVVNGTSSVHGITLDGRCKLRCVNVTVNDIITTGYGLFSGRGSLIVVDGIATVNGSSNVPAVNVDGGSFVNIFQLVALGKWSGEGSALIVNVGSNMKTTHLDTRSSVSCGAVLTVARVSSLEIVNFSNTCTSPSAVSGGGVLCAENGVVRFIAGGNTYGSINGQKYYLYGGGKVFLAGATDDRLPGTGGFCESSSFAYIGR